MERNLEWERPGIEANEGIIWHNEKNWYVKTNGHPNTDGSRWGWIEGPEPEVQWTNSGGSFRQADAERVVQQHAEWLAAQVPHDLAVIRAVQEVGQRAKEVERLGGLLALAEHALAQAEDAAQAANVARVAQHDQAISAALRDAARSVMNNVEGPGGALARVASHLEDLAQDYGGSAS